MTNLPFLLQTTNFLSQSICTNIPSHQSPGARPNSHYLCKTDCKMKQKLTTANLGCCDSPGGREGEGEGGMGAGGMSTLGRNKKLMGEKKIFTRQGRGAGKIRGWQTNGKSPKESLRNAQKSQRKKFRMSRKKGTTEKWLRCEKSAQNCSVERWEARRNIEIIQIESEWPQQNPEGFRAVSVRKTFSIQLNNQGGLRRKSLEAFGGERSHAGSGCFKRVFKSSLINSCAGKDRSIQGTSCTSADSCQALPDSKGKPMESSWSSRQTQNLRLTQTCPDLPQGWAQHHSKPQTLDNKLHGSTAAHTWTTTAHWGCAISGMEKLNSNVNSKAVSCWRAAKENSGKRDKWSLCLCSLDTLH